MICAHRVAWAMSLSYNIIALACSTLIKSQTSNCNFEMNLTPFIGNRRQRRLSNSALAMYHKSAEMLLQAPLQFAFLTDSPALLWST